MGIKRFLTSAISVRLFSVALGFVSSVLVNRALGLELRGQYTTIYTYATFVQLFLNLGICYAYSPLSERFGERAKDAVVSAIWLQGLFCVAGVALFSVAGLSDGIVPIAMLATAMIFGGQVSFIALIEDIRERNLILLLSASLYAAYNCVVLFCFAGDLKMVLIGLTAKYVLEIVLCVGRFRLIKVRLSSISKELMKDMLGIGVPTAVLAFLISCNYNISVVIMNALHIDDFQIGIFGVGYTLSNMLWVVPDAFKELVYHKSAHGSSEKAVIPLMMANMALCVTICVAFSLAGKWFLVAFYGEEFIQAFTSTLVIFIGIIPMVAFKLIHPLYVNSGKSMIVVKLLLVSVAVNVVLAFALIPAMQAMGAAVATVFSYSLCGLLFTVQYIRDFSIGKADLLDAFKAVKSYIR